MAAPVAMIGAAALTVPPSSVTPAFAATPTPAPAVAGGLLGTAPVRTTPPTTVGATSFSNTPHITGIGEYGAYQPGATVTLDGSNFGSGSGWVCVQWSRVMAQNYFTRNGTYCLDNVSWSDSHVEARLDPAITGLPDQDASLYIISFDGLTSQHVTLHFVALRARVRAPLYPVQGSPVEVRCSDDADINDCVDRGSGHTNAVFSNFDGTTGTDTYSFRLANGWTFDGADAASIDENGSAPSGTFNIESQPTVGVSSGTVNVDWYTPGWAGDVSYYLTIWVLGPAGVPFTN